MIRLDKYLCDAGLGTRSEVKEFVRKGLVSVNGEMVKQPDWKIRETDAVLCQGKAVSFQKYSYIMLNKPAGVVCATEDTKEKTVLELVTETARKKGETIPRGMFPAGRLDKDTEGLLLLTNDGALSHALLSPKKHVVKLYEVTAEKTLSAEDRIRLETGVDIGDEKPTMSAKVTVRPDGKIYLSIMEGRYHQVKRMFRAVGNRVVHLKRLRMGTLYLDENLAPGEYRYLTEKEVLGLHDRLPCLQGIKAVIFDVDGSLVDSMWVWKEIDREYLGKFRIPLPDDLQLEIEGMSFYETALYFKKRFPIPDSVEQIMEDWNKMAWEKYEREIRLKPGALEFMKLCQKRGIKMGIATSNSRELMTTLEQVHGLTEYISCIKTGTEVLKGKPEPDIYLAVAEELETAPENCLVFEDLVAGILAGKRAGMKVCAVQDAYSLDSDREKRKLADYYIEDYTQIKDES